MSMGIHNVNSDGTGRLRGTNPAKSHRLTVPSVAGADRPDSRKASPPPPLRTQTQEETPGTSYRGRVGPGGCIGDTLFRTKTAKKSM